MVISLDAMRDGLAAEMQSDFNVEEIVERTVVQEHVREAVANLPETMGKVIELRYFDDMTVSATAKALGITSATVKRLEEAALVDLKVALVHYA